MFDLEKRFMGGYGIVGGNLPLAAGLALSSDYTESDDVTVCMFGDGASNTGNFGETMNLAALWKLPIVFMVINNQFGMGTALERHSAVTNLSEKAAGYGVPGRRCDGMDVLDVHATVSEALEKVRSERTPLLVEAVTYRYRGHSMADPEDYRSKDEVEEWRASDPLTAFPKRLTEEGLLSEEDIERMDEEAVAAVDAAVDFADKSPFPDLDSLYDDIYVIGEQVRDPWYSTDVRSPGTHRGETEREAGDVARELAEAGAAHDDDTDDEMREARARGEGG